MPASGEGTVRLYATNAAETYKILLFEGRTEQLDVSTDPRQQLKVTASTVDMAEDDKLVFEMKVDAAGASANVNNTSVIRIPIRIKDAKTGAARDADLVGADFGLVAGNVAIGTAWTRVGAKTVGAQEVYRFAKANYDNSTIYMALNYT